MLAIAASAVLDAPAKTVTSGVTVPGTKGEVWSVLVDVAGYDEWNPVFRNASGGTDEGAELSLDLVLPGEEPMALEPTVVVSRPERKLWWQDRLVAPGLRDWEYEVILTPLDRGRVLVVHQLRVEGLLAPLVDAGETREALEMISRALRERLEETVSGAPAPRYT